MTTTPTDTDGPATPGTDADPTAGAEGAADHDQKAGGE